MTYTLANIPEELDRALREQAAAAQKSVEAIIVELLASFLDAKSVKARGTEVCSEGNGAWTDDPEFELALRDHHLIDWEAWDDGIKRRDLSGIAGLHLITPEMKSVFAEQRRVDPELWK